METKPYNLQSPEQIAKDYGGNKQKIAEAMQMGVLDPTAGTLAGMFIDRMRSAAQTEAAPQQSVAQQVFAPPMPPMPQGMPPMPQMPQGMPAGLGATPEAAAMPALSAAPPMGMPSPQAAPGMAAGGMVPPYMGGGGLSDLPVPDGMFDEPSNGGFGDGYRGGGLVAFAAGDLVDEDEGVDPNASDFSQGIVVERQRKKEPEYIPEPVGPEEYYGTFRDPFRMQDAIKELAPQSSERREQVNKYLDRLLSPEDQKARRKEDMWLALGQIGAKMASTPGSLLQAASAGIGEALPGIAAAAKERRAEERGALSELAKNEGLTNAEARDMYRLTREGTNQYGQFNEARLTREQLERLEMYKEQRADYRARVNAAAGITQTGMSVAGQRDVARINQSGDAARYNFQVNQMIEGMIAPGGSRYSEYLKAPDKNAFIGGLRASLGAIPSPSGGATPPPPSGYKPD